jgi:hypothetical protein
MEFILSKCGPLGLDIHIPLEDIGTEEEAITKAHETALQTKQGVLVALFNRDGSPIVGWKVLKENKLRREPLDTLQNSCGIGSGSYEYIKRQADEMRKAREKKQQETEGS